jgi:hypothetical protein
MRDLTAEERAVLAHIVVDPDAWWAHAQQVHEAPEPALAQKVARWAPDYLACVEALGAGYKTRAQREVE